MPGNHESFWQNSVVVREGFQFVGEVSESQARELARVHAEITNDSEQIMRHIAEQVNRNMNEHIEQAFYGIDPASGEDFSASMITDGSQSVPDQGLAQIASNNAPGLTEEQWRKMMEKAKRLFYGETLSDLLTRARNAYILLTHNCPTENYNFNRWWYLKDDIGGLKDLFWYRGHMEDLDRRKKTLEKDGVERFVERVKAKEFLFERLHQQYAGHAIYLVWDGKTFKRTRKA